MTDRRETTTTSADLVQQLSVIKRDLIRVRDRLEYAESKRLEAARHRAHARNIRRALNSF